MKVILKILTEIIFSSNCIAQIPRENLIVEYLFERDMLDNSGNGRHLNSYSLQTHNDTTTTDEDFSPGRIDGQFSYGKKLYNVLKDCGSFYSGCNFKFKYHSFQSEPQSQTATDGFSISYWVYN